jgi:PilZ domain
MLRKPPMAPNDSPQTADGSDPERATRINTHRVQLGRSDGVLLNLSATGALVRNPTRLAIDSEVSFGLYTDGQPVRVMCRVVRCIETPVTLAGATWKHTEFDIAIVFEQQTEALGSVFELMYRQSSRSA